MLRLVRLELVKLLRKRLLLGGVSGLSVIPVLAVLAVRYGGNAVQIRGRTPMNAFSSLHVGLMLGMSLFIPLFVAIVAADTLAGEWSEGVLRLTLMRPVGRPKLIVAKWLAVSFAIAVAMVIYAFVGLTIGWPLFDHNVLYVSGTQEIAGWAAIARIAGSIGLAVLGLTVVAGITLLISLYLRRPTAAALLTVAVIFGSQMLEKVEALQPWLLTAYMGSWQKVLESAGAAEVWRAVIVLVLSSAFLVAVAGALFNRMDVEA